MPFVALVSFDGQLLAAPLSHGNLCAGEVDLPPGRLFYRFDGAVQSPGSVMDFQSQTGVPQAIIAGTGADPAQDFHSKGSITPVAAEFHSGAAISVLELPPRQGVIEAITALQSEMRNGYSYLVNYCSQTSVKATYPAAELFAKAKAPYTFWLEGHFLSFSPEPFITVSGREISTTPMKGTGSDKVALLADAKEQAEHATVVDLLRNDLGRVAAQVRVEDYRYVSEIRRGDGSMLYQTSSRISGQMPADWRAHIGDWLPRLLPAGSISGAPKHETLELIRRYEQEPRGFFTGVAVLFDGHSLSSAVLIRFLDLAGDVPKFRSGAGITIYSDPAQEYDEIVSKVYFPA